ncbi:MAG: hypothetical protein HY663_04775 [Chloroflexi bacterium]|nr:hypothetical protein [Chloroflexota bacterium]
MVKRKRTLLNVSGAQQMEAIAFGVETRLDSALGYSKLVTEETIKVAQRLGIPEKKIQNWVAARATLYAKRMAAIKTSLDKL